MLVLLDLWIGFAAGAVGARARWPLAPDLLEATGLEPWREAAASALGLALALALVALRPRRQLARPGLTLLIGALLGAGSALLDPLHGGPVSARSPLPWLALGGIGLWVAARFARARQGDLVTTPPARQGIEAQGGLLAGDRSAPRGAGRALERAALWVALALAAAGVTAALAALGAIAARTMPDSQADHAARALTLVALLVVGAFAFGRPFTQDERPRAGGDRGAFVALVLAAFAALAALVVVSGMTTPQGLRALARRFDLDVIDSGTLPFDALVTMATYVLPAFALGAALHLVRTRGAWFALALGAAGGALFAGLRPPLGSELDAVQGALPALLDGATSSSRVMGGLFAAGLGALAGALSGAPAAGRGQRLALGLAGLAACGIAARATVAPVRVMRAYERFQPTPIAIVEGASGQFIVDPGGSGLERVTLDHRALAPTSERARGDRDQLASAFALLDDAARARGPRVLLVGLLTPGRAYTLAGLGAARVDRTAGHWRDLAAIEPFTHRNVDGDLVFAGDLIAPRVARARARDGAYDLIVVPAVEGSRPDATFLATPDAPTRTVQVQWLCADDDAAHAPLADHVLLASSGAEHFVLGRVHGAEPPRTPTASRPAYVPFAASGAPYRVAARLRAAPDARGAENEAQSAARFADAARGGPWDDLAQGLVLHLAAQQPSSPFETAAQRVELDQRALERLFAHGTLGPPDLFTRGLWNGLVEVLRAKRDVARTYEVVEPLAALWGSWSEGTLALAWADVEELDTEGALARLAPLVAAAPGERELVLGYAAALLDAQRAPEAADALSKLVALAPGDRGARKALARAQIEADDPAGRALALELLRDDPEDRELWGLLGPLKGEAPALSGPPAPSFDRPR
ncbi:MAG: hypothetical protein R3F49_05675 [Planctomycetota bacterium]